MKLYSWNVNGIRAVWNKGLFQSFILEHDPDIVCLQETKAHTHESPIDLPQYDEFWNSAEKKGYAGTAILTKIKPLEVRLGFSEDIVKKFTFADSYGDTSKEGRVISARFKDFWVVSVYTPNSKDGLERLTMRYKQWDPAFLAHIKELERNKPVLVAGDFNVAHQEIDLARPKENVGKHGFTNEERQRFSEYIEAGYIDTFRHLHPSKTDAYTWWTHWANARARNIGWRIDYWLASRQLMPHIKAANIHPDVLGSDHCPVSVEL